MNLKPCRSPYCECTPGQCSHPGCYDARGEPWPPTATVKDNSNYRLDPPGRDPLYATKPTLRVRGWVWKQPRGDGAYEPSYTPAQHVQRGELWALVDPNDLHQPLENTDWFAQ